MRRSCDERERANAETQCVPVPSTFSKIGTLDFLAVLPSGIFTFLVTYMVLSDGSLSGDEPTLWLQLQRMVTDTLGNPLILLSVLFVSYFFGTILRAFPVEWLVAALHVGRRRCPRRRATDGPNATGRRLTFRIRQGMTIRPRRPDVIPKAIINSWKHALHQRSPEAYAYFQTVEARSRFTAAMLWAGVVGVAGCVLYMAVEGSSVAVSQLALISIVVTAVFGSLLPRTCRLEVAELLILSEATRSAAQN